MNQSKLIFKAAAVLFFLTISNLCLGQNNKKECGKFSVESVNLIYASPIIKGGSIVFTDNATLEFDSKISVKGGSTNDNFKVKLTLNGVDKKLNKYTTSLDYTYSRKSTSGGGKITVKASADNPVLIQSVAIFIDDWCGETVYFSQSVAVESKTNFALLLNGISKPINKGQCRYGQCWCFSKSAGNNGTLITLDSIKMTQTIGFDKSTNQNYLEIETEINNAPKSSEAPSIEQLITWGEISVEITGLITPTYGKEPVKMTVKFKPETTRKRFYGRVNIGSGGGRLTLSVCHFKTMEGSAFGIPDATLLLNYASGYEKPKTGTTHTWNEVWVADQSTNFSELPDLNHVFMNQTTGAKYVTVKIGLSRGVKNKADLHVTEIAMSKGLGVGHGRMVWTRAYDQRNSRTVQPIEDENGNWYFIDSLEIGKEKPVLSDFQFDYYTASNDSISFKSFFKQPLNDKKGWDYKVKMNAVAADNPIFNGPNNGFTNILALTVPASGISISGGNIIIKDNSQLSMLLINTNNGDFDTTNIGSGSISMQLAEEGDGRVFWHWSFPVTTTNPKINTSFDTSKYGDLTLQSIEIKLVNDNLDTLIYQFDNTSGVGKYGLELDNANYVIVLQKTEKIKYYNPCATKYKLKKIEYSETTVSGIYVLQVNFQFAKNSDIPNALAMIVEIENCKGASEFIKLEIKYDAKTNTYTGSTKLNIEKECAWKFVYAEIAAYNKCKDQTVWSVDATKAKGNGSGTKNASSQTSTRPQLF